MWHNHKLTQCYAKLRFWEKKVNKFFLYVASITERHASVQKLKLSLCTNGRQFCRSKPQNFANWSMEFGNIYHGNCGPDSSVCPSVCLSICLSVWPFIYLSICSLVCLYVCTSVCLHAQCSAFCLCLFVHSSVSLFICAYQALLKLVQVYILQWHSLSTFVKHSSSTNVYDTATLLSCMLLWVYSFVCIISVISTTTKCYYRCCDDRGCDCYNYNYCSTAITVAATATAHSAISLLLLLLIIILVHKQHQLLLLVCGLGSSIGPPSTDSWSPSPTISQRC